MAKSDVSIHSGSPTESFLHRTPKPGILCLLLKRYNFVWNFYWNREFLLCTTVCIDCLLLQNCWQPNFIHVVLRCRSFKIWKGLRNPSADLPCYLGFPPRFATKTFYGELNAWSWVTGNSNCITRNKSLPWHVRAFLRRSETIALLLMSQIKDHHISSRVIASLSFYFQQIMIVLPLLLILSQLTKVSQ